MNQMNTLPKTSPLLPDPIKPAGKPPKGPKQSAVQEANQPYKKNGKDNEGN